MSASSPHGTAQQAQYVSPIPEISFNKIMVPVDGSDLAEKVLPAAVTLAKKFGSSVELVRAYAPPPSLLAASAASAMPGTGPVLDPAPFIAAGRQEVDIYLEEMADRLRQNGVAAWKRRLDGAAGESIVAAAVEDGADAIVMTTHGRGGLGRLVLGSVADYVLRHAPCPVLLVRVHHPHQKPGHQTRAPTASEGPSKQA